jgi:hypothetical protein
MVMSSGGRYGIRASSRLTTPSACSSASMSGANASRPIVPSGDAGPGAGAEVGAAPCAGPPSVTRVTDSRERAG